jgi:hypothetical protein
MERRDNSLVLQHRSHFVRELPMVVFGREYSHFLAIRSVWTTQADRNCFVTTRTSRPSPLVKCRVVFSIAAGAKAW